MHHATWHQLLHLRLLSCTAGHIIIGKQDILATVHGSFLCASVEIGTLRRALMYVCELRQAKPRTLAQRHGSADLNAYASGLWTQATALDTAGSVMGTGFPQTAAARMSNAVPGQQRADGVTGEASKAPQNKPGSPAAAKSQRNLTVQIFLHCARIDVSHIALAACGRSASQQQC